MRAIKKDALYWGKVVAMGAILGVGIQFAQAWTNPIAPPPNGNVPGPINTGVVDQIKNASLGLTGSMISGGIVKMGTTSAACTASLGGALRYNSSKKCVEFCDESSWKCSNEAATVLPYIVGCSTPPGWYDNPVGYCNGSDVRLSCTDTGYGRNHGVVPYGSNGCHAYEGSSNYGAPGCTVTCQAQ